MVIQIASVRESKIATTAIIGNNVSIGDNTVISDHVIIRDNVTIGDGCTIYPYAVIGEDPQDFSYAGETSFVEIGDANVIREFVTIHRAVAWNEKTVIGDGNFFMAYSHVGHNCKIGNNNVFANSVQLAGHVEIGDSVTIGGLVAVHQHCRIGSYAMLSGVSGTTKDLPPYFMFGGLPAIATGINRHALKKAKMSPSLRDELVKAFKIIYTPPSKPLSTVVERLGAELNNDIEEVKYLIEFLKSSKRGIKLNRGATSKLFQGDLS